MNQGLQNCLLIQNLSSIALSGDCRSQHIIRLKFLAPYSEHQTKMAQGQLLGSNKSFEILAHGSK